MHATTFVTDLAIVLGVAGVTAVVAKFLHQSTILGYLFAGLIVGPYIPIPVFADPARVEALAEFGVLLVMFAIGLAPYITQRNMADEEVIPTILKAAKVLDEIGLTYVHLVEADWDDAPTVPEHFRHDLREAYSGAIIVAGKYNRSKAEAILHDGLADLVAFGRPFIANPDLPHRFQEGLPLAEFDSATLFGGSAEGYTSYANDGSHVGKESQL